MPTVDLISMVPVLLALAGVVVACVAGARKTWPALDGWRVVLAVAIVSLALCTALVVYQTPSAWPKGLILGVLVTVVALGGDEYLTRLAGKASGTTVVNNTTTTQKTELERLAALTRPTDPADPPGE